MAIRTFEERLTSSNALEILRGFDIVADGTDNFPTRYLVNDACVLLGKPNVYASIFRFEGQASVFWAAKGPCYRCLYAEPPPPGLVPSCAEGGVLGVLPGLLGLMQAAETVKLVLGIGEPLVGRLVLVDALSMRFRELTLRKNPECAVCGARPTVTELIDYESFCGEEPLVSSRAMHHHAPEVSVEELKAMRDRGDAVVLVDVREPREWSISDLPGSVKIPLGTLAREPREALERRRDRRLLPDRRPERQRRPVPGAERLREGQEPGRRHQQVGGENRPLAAPILRERMVRCAAPA